MMENLFAGRKPPRALERVRIKEIRLNPYQPRTSFDEAGIAGLAQSIRECGLISPLALRRAPEGGYLLVAGERRLRALSLLGRSWADAIIIEADEAESRAISLIENIQREELNFFEEAQAMRELIRFTGITQDALAKKLGRNPSTVANRLRLLKLPEAVRDVILSARLSERHARALLILDGDTQAQLRIADAAARKGLNVKQLESMIEGARAQKQAARPRVKTVLRDKRMFVNAVADTVKRLVQSGVRASYRVEEDDKTVSVIVSIPKD